MREERIVRIGGDPYVVVLSDEPEALLAAKAAGRAVVGVWREGAVLPADYLVETPEAADDRCLERVVRRHLGLPWVIAETERLRIREFTAEDARRVPREEGDGDADRIFYTPDRLEEYIRCQYEFYEYGIWAVTDRRTGEPVGKAGVWNMGTEAPSRVSGGSVSGEEMVGRVSGGSVSGEGTAGRVSGGIVSEEGVPGLPDDVPVLELGYHIFEPFRGRGYAKEACRAIISALKESAYCGEHSLCLFARTEVSNEASVRVLRSCGFRPAGQGDGEGGRRICRYVLYL